MIYKALLAALHLYALSLSTQLILGAFVAQLLDNI